MDCPACHTDNPPGQKYCGTCGRKLESACPGCGASNPPQYKYCGQCGAQLAVSGALSLAASGLITQANPKALELLGYRNEEIQGKPFSLFVQRDDLVVFFSHWNELRSSSQRQDFEIAMKHKEGKSIYLRLDIGRAPPDGENPSQIRILLDEITDSRKVSTQLQFQEDLLNLIFSTTDAVRTSANRHMDRSIEDALKKLCLVTEADRAFIYSFNRRSKRMDPAYQWCRETSPEKAMPELTSLPLAMIKRAIVRLRKEQGYVVDDVTQLPPAERYELLAWHKADLGAVVCHLLYCAKRPIGIIGVAKHAAGRNWPPHCAALVKFLGQLLADRLPFAAVQLSHAAPSPGQPPAAAPTRQTPGSERQNVIDIAEKRSWCRSSDDERPGVSTAPQPMADALAMPDKARPMRIEELAGRKLTDQQPVFPRDDGLVLLTCPRCGFQESVSTERFEKLNNALSVTCQCQKNFAAVLEKRRALRKAVRLAGHFSITEDLKHKNPANSIWGLMVVRDLSKSGLRFTTSKANLIYPGDKLMVRFQLDNSNQALIHKPAVVISVTGEEVGCRFEGADSYDITLGFYFI
jgi:PAS domain S-box-containing protein